MLQIVLRLHPSACTASSVSMHPDINVRVFVANYTSENWNVENSYVVVSLCICLFAVSTCLSRTMFNISWSAISVDVPVERPTESGASRPTITTEVINVTVLPAPPHLFMIGELSNPGDVVIPHSCMPNLTL